jgi:hypothetical protein
VGSSFLRALEQQSVVGFGAAVLLGFTFGPRLLDWAVPGERRDPLAPSLTGAINDRARILGSLASVLMLLGGLVALVVNLAFWSGRNLDCLALRWRRNERRLDWRFSSLQCASADGLLLYLLCSKSASGRSKLTKRSRSASRSAKSSGIY